MAMSVSSSASWLENHPRMAGVLNACGSLLRYIVTGAWIVDLVRWLVDTGGNIAESAFVLATVYVTVNTVAHLLVTWVLPAPVIASLNQISVIAFSVLPELIVVAAMVVTFDHWKMVKSTGRFDTWVWAIAYTAPTLVFLGMTIYTITSFVTFEVAHNSSSPQATGAILVIRCLAGWSYGIVQMLWVKLGKSGYAGLVAGLKSEIVALAAVVTAGEKTVNDLQAKVAQLEQQLEDQGRELVTARLQVATQKVTRAKSDHENMSTGEVAQTGKVTSLHGETEKRSKLKKHLHKLVLAGERVNYKKIAADTGISYNTVRRHASTIIDEIAKERSTENLQAVNA
jgi:hypothetical protein